MTWAAELIDGPLEGRRVELDDEDGSGGARRGVACTARMELVIALCASAPLAFAILRRRRKQTDSWSRRRRDNESVRAQLEAAAEMETHDIDDMLDAIGGYRRRQGRRDVGEELADDLMRGTWEG